uniref:Uncharacterized protein n=1 Tax=Amphimedon queenslandica TaxID=400682 RepID=A0A1X7TJL5_AMPQE
TPTNSKLIYLPTVIVMVSRMPYFRLLKETLSGLLSEEEREDSFWETIEDVANELFLITCLPEGLLSLIFILHTNIHIVGRGIQKILKV